MNGKDPETKSFPINKILPHDDNDYRYFCRYWAVDHIMSPILTK